MGNSYTLPQNVKYSIEGKKARLQWPVDRKEGYQHLTREAFNATTRRANYIQHEARWFLLGGIDDCRLFFEMKQVAAVFDCKGATVDIDKLPIIYKLLYTIQHEARATLARNPEKTYKHKISRSEMIALAILGCVDYHLTCDASLFPGTAMDRPQRCQHEEHRKMRAYNLQKRDERAMTLEKELQEDMKEHRKMRIDGHLNDLLKITREELQNLTLKDDLREEERIHFLSVVRDYLHLRCRKQGLQFQRGDLIDFVQHDNSWGLSIYDGESIIDLDRENDVLLPKQFTAITEFPLFYWSDILPNRKVNINPTSLTIIAVGVANIPVIGDNMAILNVAYQEQIYTFGADFPLTRGTEYPVEGYKVERVQIEYTDEKGNYHCLVGKDIDVPVPAPSESDIKNHFLTCNFFLPLRASEGNGFVYMGRFYQSKLKKALQPLQNEYNMRTAVIQSCNFLLPELRAMIAHYTIEYYA